jgi:hypothetical protein
MAAPKAEATSQVEYDKLNERLTHLEEQVYRLLVALCCALSVILVLIFYNRHPYFLDDGLAVLLRVGATVASSFVVGWPIAWWVVGKKSKY